MKIAKITLATFLTICCVISITASLLLTGIEIRNLMLGDLPPLTLQQIIVLAFPVTIGIIAITLFSWRAIRHDIH